MRLPLRLAIQLSILAVIVSAAMAGTALVLVENTFERRLSAELAELRGSVARELELTADRLESALDGLETHLKQRDTELFEALLLARPVVRDAAGRLMAPAGLDLFEIVAADGVVLSSGHAPERFGLPSGAFAEPSARPTDLRCVASDQRIVPALLGTRRLTVGSRTLTLVAGSIVDQRLLEAVSARHAVLLLGGADVRSLSNRRGAPLIGPALGLPRLRDNAPGAEIELRDDAAGVWIAAPAPLRAPDCSATIAVAVHRGPVDRLLARMRTTFLWIGLVAALTAALAGVGIARGITRPVGRLVRRVDAIAAGEEDYSFSGLAGDELEELAASFSRLHRSLELQRRRSAAAERVAAWREVARHVAHEVKNPLAPIRLTVQNLLRVRRQLPDRFEPLFEEGMTTILEEVEQLSRMVGEFSEFARLPQPVRRLLDPRVLLDGVVELFTAEPDLTVERRYAARLPQIAADADQLSRALKNVVGNAVEAMRACPPGERRLLVDAYEEDVMLTIEIADSGPGLTEEQARRLFEPYFTTKTEGTGLGLAITYRIVTEHDGFLHVGARPGGGTVILIRLPLPDGRTDETPATASQESGA